MEKSKLFKVHILNELGLEKAKELANHFEDVLEYVEDVAESGRELSLFKTHLEQACFYAKKAICLTDKYQKKD